MNWNKEAEQIMEERFGGDNEMALATCRGNVPSVRTVNATYWRGAFTSSPTACPEKWRKYGTTPRWPSLGSGSPATGRRRAWVVWQGGKQVPGRHLRQSFASWIDNGHNDFADENTIILQVRVTDAVLLSHGRRFEK